MPVKDALKTLHIPFQTDAPMRLHTTFRVGGPADLLLLPRSERQISDALHLLHAYEVPTLVMGKGSNLLVRDGGFRGAVIKLAEDYAGVETSGSSITARAGTRLSALVSAALESGLVGLEFAAGNPGTVGGGVYMNAGAYGGELSDFVTSVRVLERDHVRNYTREQMEFSYRSSRLMRTGGTLLSATFALKRGDTDAARAQMREYNARRREKQPLELPSAGSTFKRPKGGYAGALIEQAGLKGTRIGGAEVSAKHAGFIVNTGGATARDVIALIEHVQSRVYKQCGVQLEPEVRIVGEDGPCTD